VPPGQLHQSATKTAAPIPAPSTAANITSEVGGTLSPRESAFGAVGAAAWLNVTMMSFGADGRLCSRDSLKAFARQGPQ
jgi:hypothetical protein